MSDIPPDMTPRAHQVHRIAGALSMLAACVSAIMALNVFETTPRFAYAPLNCSGRHRAGLVRASRPALACARCAGVLGATVIATALAIPLGLFSLFAFFELQSVMVAGVDKRFEQISPWKGEPTHYRLYRTNGGATTAYGIVLRRERDGLPGVKLVSVVHAYDRAHDATLQRLPSGMIELRVAPYGAGETTQRLEFSP